MILKCIKNTNYFDVINGTDKFAITVNHKYECLPCNMDYFRVLVYNDNKQWLTYPIELFAPIEPKPLIEWEE